MPMSVPMLASGCDKEFGAAGGGATAATMTP